VLWSRKDKKCIQNLGWEALKEITILRLRCREEDNIKMALREIRVGGFISLRTGTSSKIL
jgi:hypothetical protein